MGHRWPNEKDAVRANLGFFIGLRNKIEHRYARHQEALTAAVGGHAQALLFNYEEELSGQFGVDSSLATRLRFPVFIGSFTDEGERTLRRFVLSSRPPCGRSSLTTTPDSTRRSSTTPDTSSGSGSCRNSPRRTQMRWRCGVVSLIAGVPVTAIATTASGVTALIVAWGGIAA